jgi:hypothetical protein
MTARPAPAKLTVISWPTSGLISPRNISLPVQPRTRRQLVAPVIDADIATFGAAGRSARSVTAALPGVSVHAATRAGQRRVSAVEGAARARFARARGA